MIRSKDKMLRFLVILALLTAPAFAAPRYVDETKDGTRLVCVLDLTKDQYDALWIRLLQELEFAGYKKISEGARGHADFSNGFYTVFVSQNDNGPCVQYMDPFQPQIPAMHIGSE